MKDAGTKKSDEVGLLEPDESPSRGETSRGGENLSDSLSEDRIHSQMEQTAHAQYAGSLRIRSAERPRNFFFQCASAGCPLSAPPGSQVNSPCSVCPSCTGGTAEQ